MSIAASSPNDSFTEQVKEGEIDTVNTPARYLAYAARLRTALTASSRYLAYTSEVGEAFRPIVRPALVTAAYGVSWAYILGDVAYEGYKAHHAGESPSEIGVTVVKRGVFQSIASMLLPAAAVHTTVKYTAQAFKNVKQPRIRAWGPSALGLAVVPMLPVLFDEPVEHVIDRLFEPLEQRVKTLIEPKAVYAEDATDKKAQ
ncbi:mitochondrial 18 KDa protein-domain-containing protein [Gongronella butleri]|nr:mitochondrial 18 KDa protein-domain-containing protein [Gongronella butleri]